MNTSERKHKIGREQDGLYAAAASERPHKFECGQRVIVLPGKYHGVIDHYYFDDRGVILYQVEAMVDGVLRDDWVAREWELESDV